LSIFFIRAQLPFFMPSLPIRLFIVDDHAAIRFAMEAWTEKALGEMVVVGTAENGTDALRLIPAANANFLLINCPT
jgi:DNA-binding NarL/FixJ family response regulator